MRITVEAANMGYVPDLARDMRDADRDEVGALGFTPAAALNISLANSWPAWVGLIDGTPACMFGVGARSILGGEGEPWLLGTPALAEPRLAVLRATQHYVPQMLAVFPRLSGMVDARNVLSVRWLKWLGFDVGGMRPHGPYGLPFRPFTMEA